MNIIHIILSTDLPTRAQNRLRYAIELGLWRTEWRLAEQADDYNRMDELNRFYERVGLP